jgi:hypothetical protein
MVIFQGGRPNDGYVVGRLYGPDDPPPSFNYGDWQIRHESGSKMVLDKSGNVTTTSKGNAKSLLDKDGNASVESSGGAKATLKSGGDIEAVSSGNAKLTLKSGGDVEAQSSGGLKLTLKSNGDMEVTSTNATFKVTAGGKFVMSNATAELLTLLDDLLTQLTTAGNILGAGPPAAVVSQFNPATLVLLNLIKTKLATLKQ